MPRFAAAAAATLAALGFPATASAHALAGRRDLPIDEVFFAWGAALVLIVSFAALAVSWRTPRFETSEWRPVRSWISRALLNPGAELLAGLLGVVLLAVTVWSGLDGTEAPDRNFSVTFVFVTFWLGLVAMSVLFGDVFRAFNPWRAIARTVSGVFQLVARQPAPPALSYPERLGRWPAAIGLLAFVWLELVYGQSGFATVGLTPRTVAIATLAYSAYTFVGMAMFGIERWLQRGETFAVYFGMFARLAPLEARDGVLGRRPWLTGATDWGLVPGSVALILLTIAGTTFDGAQEGLLSDPIRSLFELLFEDIGIGPVASLRIASSVFFALTVAVVAGIYWAGVKGMASEGGDSGLRKLGRAFAHSFVPIGLAYLFAHYFTLVLFQEQAQFTYLLSDPLGDGSNYFGTAERRIDQRLIGAETIWYVQVASLVIGHVAALAMGHDKALAVYDDVRRAARSQYWMLALMISFTVLALILLSFANG